MTRVQPLRSARDRVAASIRRYFDPQFAHLNQRLDELVPAAAALPTINRAKALARIDVSRHNAGGTPPSFEEVVSQAVSAAQFADPSFERLRRVMFPGAVTIPWGSTHASVTVPHRKLWEFVYILRAAEQHGKLEPGARALGFGVGQEPIPAVLARHGLSVLATDLDAGTEVAAGWASGGQHMTGLDALSRPDVVPDAVLQQHVSTRYVDMSDVPDDLGRFDLVWSACALEHLGPPADAGLEFVMRSLDLLEPGGIAVHTTELELTPRAETEYVEGTAIYRIDDLDRLAGRVRELGFEMPTNWYVSLDTPSDRWVSMPPHPQDDPSHLKLELGDSVSTSVGLLIRRPS